MEFQTSAQQECYQRVAVWMDVLFSDLPWEKLDRPGFGLCLGSAWAEVRVLPWNRDSVIDIRSTVVAGAEVSSSLQAFLLNKNAELLFGAFSVNGAGEILFSHTIVGSTCDPNELEASVKAVLQTADEYDDQIVALWGGERALDRAPQ